MVIAQKTTRLAVTILSHGLQSVRIVRRYCLGCRPCIVQQLLTSNDELHLLSIAYIALLVCIFDIRRLVKNRRTGIDASVPSYERADNPRDVKFYHVLVVTNLPHPKSGEFAAEDVVQFMVSYEVVD